MTHGASHLPLSVLLAWSACAEPEAASDPGPPALPRTQSAGATPRAPAPDPQDPAADPGEPEPGAPNAMAFEEARAARRAGNPTRAAELFGRACDGGQAQACYELAGLLRHDGKLDDRTAARAGDLVARACALGSPAACDELGH